MFRVGELRDQNLTKSIHEELLKRGIETHVLYDEKSDVYLLACTEENRVAEAQDYYRVRVGLPKEMKMDPEWEKIKTLPRGEMTYGIVIFCVVIYGLSYLNVGQTLYNLFYISRPESTFLAEVFRGQIWRLLTPIFIHLSILHILFNMMWFKDLGYIIENKLGRNYLMIFILISGVFSNLMQYFVAGPSFGGMSGVLYGMLGFIWVYSKMSPDFEYGLPKRDITIMLGWLVLCLTGFLGPIANTAHAAGLYMGIILALIKVKDKNFKLALKYNAVAWLFLIATVGVEYLKKGSLYLFLITSH